MLECLDSGEGVGVEGVGVGPSADPPRSTFPTPPTPPHAGSTNSKSNFEPVCNMMEKASLDFTPRKLDLLMKTSEFWEGPGGLPFYFYSE